MPYPTTVKYCHRQTDGQNIRHRLFGWSNIVGNQLQRSLTHGQERKRRGRKEGREGGKREVGARESENGRKRNQSFGRPKILAFPSFLCDSAPNEAQGWCTKMEQRPAKLGNIYVCKLLYVKKKSSCWQMVFVFTASDLAIYMWSNPHMPSSSSIHNRKLCIF